MLSDVNENYAWKVWSHTFSKEEKQSMFPSQATSYVSSRLQAFPHPSVLKFVPWSEFEVPLHGQHGIG